MCVGGETIGRSVAGTSTSWATKDRLTSMHKGTYMHKTKLVLVISGIVSGDHT